MKQAYFRFYNGLNDFLETNRREVSFQYTFQGRQSVKHLIEALGVPHTEVERILVNGEPVTFGYLVEDYDQVAVHPPPLAPGGVIEAAEQEQQDSARRFILDNHLGKLAGYLRMLGFDSLYRNDYQDGELALSASQEGRTLLTRDRRLLMRSIVTEGYCVRHLDPERQIEEVIQRYNLYASIRPFQRCLRCNGVLEPVAKEEVIDRLEPLTRLYFEEFRACPACGQVYWKGSHYERMLKFIERLVRKAA